MKLDAQALKKAGTSAIGGILVSLLGYVILVQIVGDIYLSDAGALLVLVTSSTVVSLTLLFVQKKKLVSSIVVTIVMNLAVIIILYLSGILTVQCADCCGGTQTGFAKIKPYSYTEPYFFERCGHTIYKQMVSHDGSAEFTFRNAAGIPITVDENSINLTSQSPQGLCDKIAVSKTVIGVNEEFTITASGCPQSEVGSVYSLFIEIPYSINLQGMITNHKDVGTLRGPYK